jgi:hemolysin activation/secretion protein
MDRSITGMFRSLTARHRGGLSALLLAAGLIATGPAFAQGPAQTPTSGIGTTGLPTVDRDRSDRVAPPLAAPPSSAIQTPPSSVVAAPAITTAATVQLTRVRFAGASLAPAKLDASVADYIGQPLSTTNLQAIAAAVGRAYANSDIAFYSVSIPAQTPVGGILIVHIVEGTVKQYTLAGASLSTPTRLIEAHVGRIMRETPLHKSVLERSMSLMRDIPGQTITAQVRQLDGQGALALDLTVKRLQVQIDVTIDNNGVNNAVNGVQVQTAVTVNGVLREGDSTRVSGYLPLHQKHYQFYSISHSTPIGTNGLTFSANAAQVRTKSLDQNLEGKATLAGVAFSYPLIRSYKTNLSLSLSLDGVDSSNYFLDTRFGDYHSRAVRVGASFSKTDEKSGYAVSAVVSRGLDILDAKAFTGFSETQFTKVNVQTVAVRTIKKSITLKTTLNGQYSRDLLPVTERIALGGPGAGRPFRVGTVTAERAVTGSAEIAYKLPAKSPVLKGTTVYTFADGAIGRSLARPFYGITARNYSLASIGAGARLVLGKWQASIEAALPVKRPASNYSRRARLFFGLGRRF